MALLRIARADCLLNTFPQISQRGNLISEQQWVRRVPVQCAEYLHLTNRRNYPDAPVLPLPLNVSEIFANETGRFTPERARDIATPILIYGNSKASTSATLTSVGTKVASRPTFQHIASNSRQEDHVNSYDCSGAISLNGSMQSNVPKPFCSTGKSTHFNMPGGQWAKDSKYIAETMQKSHYRSGIGSSIIMKFDKNDVMNKCVLNNKLLQNIYNFHYVTIGNYSTGSDDSLKTKSKQEEFIKLTKRERFKKITKDYGITVMVFHIIISLISLGGIYMAVISEIDLMPYVTKIINSNNEKLEQLMSSSSSFVVAYTIHKLFAPVRLSITCAVTPWLVKYLRKVGILKTKKPH